MDASNATDKVKEVVATHPVVVFSKTTCPFCFELKRTLNTMGVEYAVVEVDKSASMAAIQKALGEVSNITTVPNLFVAGKSYGGCVDVKARLFHGKLQTVLAPYQTKVPAPEEELKRHSLFYFPETVNGNAVRLASFFTFVHAVLCCIFYRHSATRWAVLALMIDFVARVLYGGTYSLMGMLANVVLSRTAPRFVAGPPKQFAALCGVFFSVFASGLFLGDEPVGGCIVLVLLAGAASLETIFDFCLGCWMFGLAIRFGFVSPSIYRPYLNMREEKVYAYNFTHQLRTFPAEALQNQHLLAAGQTTPTPVDLIRKVRPELEFKLQDIDLIRHTTVDFFAIPMAVATLAFMFQTVSARYPVVDFDGGYASQVLIVIAVVLGGLFVILYGARAIVYPQKALKEWYHPLASNYFSAMNILVVLIGLCYIQRNHVGGMTLIWIGAIGQMLLTVFKVSDWVYRRWSEDWESPVLMMIPVGNFIAAIGFGTIHQEYGHSAPNFKNDIQYNQLGRLWFGVAMLFALVLFTITLRRTFHDSKVDNRHRVGLWVWLATAAAVGPAYLSVYQSAAGAVAAGTDVFYQSMWGIALFFFTILSMGYVRGFFSYTNDLSMWIVPFSLAVFAINTIQYYRLATDGLFLGLAIITGAVACASQAVTAAHTLYMFADGTLWVPKAKWGPLSFLKLTHEAFRFYLPQLEARIGELNALTQANGTDAKTTQRLVDAFVTEVDDLLKAFEIHSAHEDEVAFPMMRRFFPGLVPDVDAEHESLHATVIGWKALVQEYRDTSRAHAGDAEAGGSAATVATLGQKVLSTLAADFGAWSTAVQAHLRHEEDSITVVARKYLPLELARQVTHACFTEVTTAEDWAVMFRFVLASLPVFQWKIRYVKAFVWGVPERAQEIGLIVYRNVDRATWLALTQELPEIIPRGLAGHQRLY